MDQRSRVFGIAFDGNKVDVYGDNENPVFITSQICQAMQLDEDEKVIKEVEIKHQGNQYI